MVKTITIFIVTFSIVMLVNQISYGSCFASYCLSAALPKVTLLSVVISAFIVWGSKK